MFAMLLAACAISCTKRPLSVPDGDIAASLASAPAIGAHAFEPTSLLGKPTLVLFVSPTCEHCLAEMPRAQQVAAAEHANIVAVFVVGKRANAEDASRSMHFAGPVLVDDGTLRHKYEITGVPYTLVLKADGHGAVALRGEQDESDIRDAIAAAR